MRTPISSDGCGHRIARTRVGFTLIELLVVIGIIGVLTALLMPALGKARKDALKINCMSNMKDVGVHLQAYSNQWKGWLFPSRRGADKPREERWPLFVFNPPVWNPPILLCPADDPNPVNEHSYLLNDNLTRYAIKNHTTHAGASQSSANIILMGEKVTSEDDYYMNPEVSDYIGVVEYYRHGINYGSNYLFLDGHVETAPPASANMYIDPWNPTRPIPPP